MLYPIQNNERSILDISGLWKFKADPTNAGEHERWYEGFDSDLDVAVPGSWNEQLEEAGLLSYVGRAWFSKDFFLSRELHNKKLWLRVGSADYRAKAWVNGKFVGEHEFGFMPFEFQINDYVKCGETVQVIIMVDNELTHDSIPQGISSDQYQIENRLREETFPPARFDFFPFGGIQRTVQIVSTPHAHLDTVKVKTHYSSGAGSVSVALTTIGIGAAKVVAQLKGDEEVTTAHAAVRMESSTVSFELAECRPWSPEDPFLYELTLQLVNGDRIIDEYSLPIGIREVKIEGNRLYLNGNEIYLKGFGRHEDFSVIGKGLFLPALVKDFQLLQWIGANSFRTSHYPYAEETMYYADRKGFLIIDEVPAVSLDFRQTNGKTLELHKQFVKRLFDRDMNHPSVVIWSLGNEPNLVGEDSYMNGSGRVYWKEVFDYARTLDDRPMVVPNCLRAGINDPVLEFSDIVCINRYYGWYEYPGRLGHGVAVLEKELDVLYEKYQKPIMMTEFGADTIPGMHSTSDQMFTEEFQEKLISMYIAALRSKEYVIGEHVWNFADFRTPQNLRRVVHNMKGVFTRARSPKLAAFTLKKIWGTTPLTKKSEQSCLESPSSM